jgi:glucan phosphoethanolaminetransferase (alkaline phosphatase superfamily)
MTINEDTPKKKKEPFLYVLSLIASWLIALFPCIFLINQNFKLLGSDDLWLAIGVVSLHWFLLLLINLAIFREGHKASLATIIAVLPLSLFNTGLGIVQGFLPGFFYWHGLITFLIVYGVICFLIYQKLQQKNAFKINIIFGAVFLALILFNTIPLLVKTMTEKKCVERPKATAINHDLPSSQNRETLPNIYLFLFDEYSGKEAMNRYYGYDNQKFYNRLNELGFNISHSSRNYVALTKVELPNLLNLSVDGDNYTEAEKDALMQNPTLFNILKSLGYDINLINDQKFISTPGSYFKYAFNPTSDFQRSESLMSLMIDRSAYYPLLKTIVGNRMQEVFGMFQYGAESSELQESGLFTFAYLSFPHLPWFVDEHGNKVDENDQMNWDDTNIYLGQLKYSSKLILELVNKILANDPESCIILLSDHGFRLPEMQRKYHGIEAEDKVLEEYYMRNILQAVYYFGEQMDFDGYSGINVLRTILDNLFSLNLGLIEEAR